VVQLPNPAGPGTPPVIVAESAGFLLTDAGAVLDANTLTAAFFDAARPVVAVATLPGSPDLIVGFADGTLEELAPGAGGFVDTDLFADTSLADLSALAAVNVDGQLEIYALEAGRDDPVVFALAPRVPESPFAGGPDQAAELAEGVLTSVQGAELGSVVTVGGLGRPTAGAPVAPQGKVPGEGGEEGTDAVVLGVDFGPGTGPQQSIADGDEPVRVLLEFLPLVERLTPEGENIRDAVDATAAGLQRATVVTTRSVAERVARALEAVGLAEVPLPDLGLGELGADVVRKLAEAGREIGVRLSIQGDAAPEEDEMPPPPEESGVRSQESGVSHQRAGWALPALPDRPEDTSASAWGYFMSRDEQPSPATAEGNDHSLTAALSSAVFAAGFFGARGRATSRAALRRGRRA
jgi:hypothetical protein